MITYYATGRDYGTPQVLEITAPSSAEPFDVVVVNFADSARGISGSVRVLGIELDNDVSLGKAVLQAYDDGQYALR